MAAYRAVGSQWGNPNAPKFNYGPKEASPVVRDLNWRAVIEKENSEFDARMESMDKTQGLATMAHGVKEVDRRKEKRQEKEMRKVVELERTMKEELGRITSLIGKSMDEERRAREAAERRAEDERAERRRLERDIRKLSKTVRRLKRSHSGAAGASVLSGASGYSDAGSALSGMTGMSSVVSGSRVGGRGRRTRGMDRMDTVRSGSVY